MARTKSSAATAEVLPIVDARAKAGSKEEIHRAEANIAIRPPDIRIVEFRVTGTTPYVQHRFWKKAEMMRTQEEGSRARSKKVREKRDFERDYVQSQYRSEGDKGGWHGIPATAFRNALISSCKLVGFHMTRAKLALFVMADGQDPRENTPLVKIEGKPKRWDAPAKNDNGSADIRARPMWEQWKATVKIQYDADQFSQADVTNLMHRAGLQVGIGEGRPDSKDSAGLGFGTFDIVESK